MMFFIFALSGIIVASALNWAVDYLPRFASAPSTRAQIKARPKLSSALVELVASAFSPHQARRKPAWLNLAVEVTTAGLFVGAGALWRQPIDGLFAAAASAFFILIAAIDLKYRLVLNVMTLPAIGLIVLARVMVPGTNLLAGVLGGAFGFGIFWLAAFLRPGDLGSGDVKLATLIGLFFGFPNAIWALLIAVFAGGVAVIVLVFARHSKLNARIPYAPFLCLGAVSVLFASPFITFW